MGPAAALKAERMLGDQDMHAVVVRNRRHCAAIVLAITGQT